MKKLLTASIISLLPFVSAAQELPALEPFYFYNQQICSTIQIALQNAEDYGETVLFTGVGIQYTLDGSPISNDAFLFVNQDTGTWALITMYPDGSACLSTVGYGFEPYSAPR
jgi:hypothetical protein